MKGNEDIPEGGEAKQAKAPMTRHRRERILEKLGEQGVVRVRELASELGVSEVTVRNDLEQLEKEGKLLRDRGGAIVSGQRVTSLAGVDQRATLNHESKCRIGAAAALLIQPGDTIILDAGTTVVEVAKLISGIERLTVITNALPVAMELGGSAHVILLGGTFHRAASSTIGVQSERQVAEFVAQKLFLGTQAFDLEHGLTDSTSEIAQLKRAMITAARQVILLTDSSKWQRSGFAKVTPLTQIDVIITDNGLPAEARLAIENLGIQLILV